MANPMTGALPRRRADETESVAGRRRTAGREAPE